MKKYLIAAVVAVMAFSMAAFAASLNVDGGTLQAGVDRTLACSDDANITYAHHTDYHHQAGDAWVEAITVTFDSTDCMGNTMYLTIGSDDTFDPGSNDGLGGVIRLIDGQSVTIPVTNGSSWNNGISIADLESVSVTVFSDVSNSGQNIASGNTYGFAGGVFADLKDT